MATPSGAEEQAVMQAGLLACMTTPAQGNVLPPGAVYACDNGKFGKAARERAPAVGDERHVVPAPRDHPIGGDDAPGVGWPVTGSALLTGAGDTVAEAGLCWS
ncbi:hypothetical protein [Streptomyces tauricus]|uniref:hypothetical protein n=1 Tax=Streptomyces tauricus TaxID=68274 RepID=UPI0033A221B9